MLLLLSPAKRLREQPDLRLRGTQPLLKADTQLLLAQLQSYSKQRLQKLLGVSDALASLNYTRYQSFNPEQYDRSTAVPAMWGFDGDVYRGFAIDSLSSEQIPQLQQRVAILSGLYGLLRPCDWLQPYRLEMGTRLANARGDNLYDFWQQPLSRVLKRLLRGHREPIVVNLASQEYFKSVPQASLDKPVLHIQFKQQRQGKWKTIGLLAKRARGQMARFVVDEALETPQSLQSFSQDGYRFQADASDASHYVFASTQV